MLDEEKNDCPHFDDDFKEIIEKFLTVCMNVSITPHIEVKPVKTERCGKPIITPGHGCDHKDNECKSCDFTIIQKMKVEIPIVFDAKTVIKDPFVDCEFYKDDDEY